MTLSPDERRLIENIAILRRELEDRKQRRPEEGPPTVVRPLGGAAVAASATLSVLPARGLRAKGLAASAIATEETANPTLTYDDPDRGYDRGEYSYDPFPEGQGFGSFFGRSFG